RLGEGRDAVLGGIGPVGAERHRRRRRTGGRPTVGEAGLTAVIGTQDAQAARGPAGGGGGRPRRRWPRRRGGWRARRGAHRRRGALGEGEVESVAGSGP